MLIGRVAEEIWRISRAFGTTT